MSLSTDFWVITALAIATFLCRVAGFYFMRLVPFTPRVRRGLAALPGSVMMAVIVPGVWQAGAVGAVAVGASLLSMYMLRRDVAAMVLGCAAVAAARASGWF